MCGKFDEIMAGSKLSELFPKQDADHTTKVIVWILAIIGAVAAVAAIAYVVYSFFTPDYLADFAEDFDDDFDDDFFDDEDEVE